MTVQRIRPVFGLLFLLFKKKKLFFNDRGPQFEVSRNAMDTVYYNIMFVNLFIYLKKRKHCSGLVWDSNFHIYMRIDLRLYNILYYTSRTAIVIYRFFCSNYCPRVSLPILCKWRLAVIQYIIILSCYVASWTDVDVRIKDILAP